MQTRSKRDVPSTSDVCSDMQENLLVSNRALSHEEASVILGVDWDQQFRNVNDKNGISRPLTVAERSKLARYKCQQLALAGVQYYIKQQVEKKRKNLIRAVVSRQRKTADPHRKCSKPDLLNEKDLLLKELQRQINAKCEEVNFWRQKYLKCRKTVNAQRVAIWRSKRHNKFRVQLPALKRHITESADEQVCGSGMIQSSSDCALPINSDVPQPHVLQSDTARRSSKFTGAICAELINNQKLGQSMNSIVTSFGISKRTLYRYKKKGVSAANLSCKRRVLKPNKGLIFWKSKVCQFLSRDEVSRTLPNKKNVLRNLSNNSFVSKRLLLMSKLKSFNLFTATYPEFKKSFATFKRIFPKHIKRMSASHRRQCCCATCVNMESELTAFCTKSDNKVTNQEMVQSVFCKLPKINCITGKCETCPVINNTILSCNDNVLNTLISYHVWERKPVHIQNESNEIKVITKQSLVRKVSTMSKLRDEILSKATTFAQHLHVAHHQIGIAREINDNLPQNHLKLTIDFAENLTLFPQDEIQSAHWTQQQVTIVPCIISRHDFNSCPEIPVIIHESLIFISDNLTHNAQFVQIVQKKILQHVRENVPHQKISVVHRFSDGCASQFKGKFAFGDLLNAAQTYGVEIRYYFYGTGHGKSACDGEGGVVKSYLRQSLLDGHLVTNAFEAYQCCVKNLAKQSGYLNRYFYYIDKQVEDNANSLQAYVVKGCRSYHSFLVHNGAVFCRPLSCFCNACKHGLPLPNTCKNNEFVGEFSSSTQRDKCVHNLQFFCKSDCKTVPSILTANDSVSVEQPLPNSTAKLFKKDTYVAAVYEKKWYAGVIISSNLDPTEYVIKLMSPPNSQHVLWPARDNIVTIAASDVLCHIIEPSSLTSSKRTFCITHSDFVTINKNFNV